MGNLTRRNFVIGTAAAAFAMRFQSGLAAPRLSLDTASEAERAEKSNAWLEISTKVFKANIVMLRTYLNEVAADGKKVKICVVMKADAYGHGIAMLLPVIYELNQGYIKAGIEPPLCIGFTGNEEARVIREYEALRSADDRKSMGMPIRLVRLRTATLDEIKEGRRVAADPKKENYDIEELIGNQALAVEVNKLGSEANPIRIHIGLNAGGMSRNGFELTTRSGVVVEEVKKELQGIAGDLKNLKVVGLMTHFPVESRTDDKAGLNLFKTQVKIIDDDPAFSAWKQADRHVANSFATMNVKETHLNMVRVGGALYGDVDDVDYVRTAGGTATAHFERAMTFKSKVASINFYRQGSTVSYGRTRLLTRDSRLANIPVGYSDGYRRDFTNLAYVLIKGHRVPVMGRVTMNTIMVDVTDFIGGADGIVRDSEVVLFGRQGDEEITQDSLEDASDTSGAEFTTVWGQLNPRKLAADSIGTARRK